MPARIGTVSFLNACPLVAGLEDDLGARLRYAAPGEIADLLARGDLDVGLVPVVEAARQRLWALPGPAIAARRAVRSVLLASGVPLRSIRRLALDPASRTSTALVRLLLRRVAGVEPETTPAADPDRPIPRGADAALLIGDRALRHDLDGLEVVDLAHWWIEWTARPFVFALWAGPDRERVVELGPPLTRARERGLAGLAAIAAREGPPRGIPAGQAEDYLRAAVCFDAGALEVAGLELFLSLLREDGELAAGDGVRFAGAVSPGSSA